MTLKRASLVALLVALAFPPVGLWPLAWLAFVLFFLPFFSPLKENNKKNARSVGLYFATYSFVVNVLGFYWLAYTLHEFADVPWIFAAIFMLVIFCLFSILSFFLGWICFKLKHAVDVKLKKQGWSVHKTDMARFGVGLLIVIAWDCFDLRLFPWTPAMAVGVDSRLLSSVYFLGTTGWRLIFFVSTFLMASIWARKLSAKNPLKKKYLLLTGVALFVLGIGYGVGIFAQQTLKARYSERQPIALLQGNIGNYEKKLSKLGFMPTVTNVMRVHQGLIEQVRAHYASEWLGKPHASSGPLVSDDKPQHREIWTVWPETSFPGFPTTESSMTASLIEWTSLTHGLHLVGAYENAPTPFAGKMVPLDFNITALFHESKGYVAHSQKMIRIPFGEYIPFDNTFPKLYEYLPAVNHFGKGLNYRPLAHPDPSGPVFVPVVCYEVLYAGFVDDYVAAARAQYPGRPLVIVNPTNDSWYGPTSEPFQHSLLARWAAVRQGLASMRATNTGLSQIIAPWGEVISQGPRDETTVVFGDLPVQKAMIEAAGAQK